MGSPLLSGEIHVEQNDITCMLLQKANASGKSFNSDKLGLALLLFEHLSYQQRIPRVILYQQYRLHANFTHLSFLRIFRC